MKRMIIVGLALLLLFATGYAAITNSITKRPTAHYWSGNPEKDTGWAFLKEVETLLGATAGTASPSTCLILGTAYDVDYLKVGNVLWDKTDTSPTATEGAWYFDDSENCPKFYNGSSWVALAAGTGDNTLDDAYDQGSAGAGRRIDATDGAVDINSTDADAAFLFTVRPTPSSSAATGGVQITSGSNATQDSLQVVNNGSGDDIQAGGGAFKVASDGSITGLDAVLSGSSGLDVQGSGGITLENDETITNATDEQIKFAGATEDVSFQFENNQLTFLSGSGVTNIDFGELDTLRGIEYVYYDAKPCYHYLVPDSAGDDFELGVMGSQDASLKLYSQGTAADALIIKSSQGGVDILATGAASGEDIDIVATGSSVNIESTEGAADAVTIEASTAAGGIDITSQADIDITTTGADGEDITVTNTGGSIVISATEDDAGCISITENGGTSGAILIHADQGIAATENGASIALLSDAGGISIHSEANLDKSIKIVADGGADETIYIQSDQGTGDDSIILLSDAGGIDVDAAKSIAVNSSENAADAIQINASAGGIDIDAAGAAGEDIDVNNAAGSILLQANEDVADSVYIRAATGGIDVFADGAAGKDIDVNCVNGSVTIAGGEDAADAVDIYSVAGGIDVDATGEAGQDIDVNNTGGSIRVQATEDVADAVYIRASAGGIDISADGAAAKDVDISNTNGSVNITAGEDVASSIYIHADAGTSETVKIHSDQGISASSIDVTSDVGGVTVTAEAANGAGIFTVNSLVCVGAAGTLADNATPDVSTGSYWETGAATTYTDFDVGSGTVAEGTIIIIKSLHAAVFDVTGSELEGGTTDLTTASGDLTAWVYDGASKWRLLFFMDMSDDLS